MPMTAADIIVASVQANPPGGDVAVSPAVRVLVEEIVRLRATLEVASAAKIKLLPIFQFIGFAETGIEHGAKAITDEWLARLAKHAKASDVILRDVCNI